MLISNFVRFSATDCINGTLYDSDVIPHNFINFTTFWKASLKWRDVVDYDQKFLPMQNNLTISNDSHLFINLEGCVNTLKGECKLFLITHGRDGRNQTAQSRFPCFYNKVIFSGLRLDVELIIDPFRMIL